MKLLIQVPVRVGNQTETQAHMEPKKFIQKEIEENNKLVFLEAAKWGNLIGLRLYFLNNNATYWHFVTSTLIINDFKNNL